MQKIVPALSAAALAALTLAGGSADGQTPAPRAAVDGSANPQVEKIAPYHARFGRKRPVVAVLSQNSGTELTDFVIPFGVLSQSHAAEVVTVSSGPGVVHMRPALLLQAQDTLARFDTRFPQGADYVIVPALLGDKDPAVTAWLKAQAAKGSTIVSICEGAATVAAAGLMDGHRATGHWAAEQSHLAAYPEVKWEKNIRYVADGKIVSSAGISASLPISIALVEAIAGHAKAQSVATEFGVADWSSRHDSDSFRLGDGGKPLVFNSVGPTQSIGVTLAPGVDEIALALTAEAYSHTGVSKAFALSTSDAPVRTRHGLLVLPEKAPSPLDRTLPTPALAHPALALDKALAEIASVYGRAAAYGSARRMEYPGFHE